MQNWKLLEISCMIQFQLAMMRSVRISATVLVVDEFQVKHCSGLLKFWSVCRQIMLLFDRGERRELSQIWKIMLNSLNFLVLQIPKKVLLLFYWVIERMVRVIYCAFFGCFASILVKNACLGQYSSCNFCLRQLVIQICMPRVSFECPKFELYVRYQSWLVKAYSIVSTFLYMPRMTITFYDGISSCPTGCICLYLIITVVVYWKLPQSCHWCFVCVRSKTSNLSWNYFYIQLHMMPAFTFFFFYV